MRKSCLIIGLLLSGLPLPHALAEPSMYDNRCKTCHGHATDTRTCIGCHEHGSPSSASTDRSTYGPLSTVTVSLKGPTDKGGWARAIFYDQTGKEMSRITGPTEQGDDGTAKTTDQYPFSVKTKAPAQPGSYRFAAAWWGSRNNHDHTDTREARLQTNSFTVVLPTGTVSVQGGAAATASKDVSLTLTSKGPGSAVRSMRFSNDDATWSDWENYATTKAWQLTEGDGAKTVSMQLRDADGFETASFSDGIVLDTLPPEGSVTIEGGESTTSVSVTLSLSATDAGGGVAEMSFSDDGAAWSAWEAYAASKPWTLPGDPGEKTVYAQFRDAAGNVSETASDSILLGGLRRGGDLNADGILDLSDTIWLLGHLFLGSAGTEKLPCEGGDSAKPGPGDLAVSDFNGDGGIDISDAVSMLSNLFLGGQDHPLGRACASVGGCSDRCQ